jgi:serine/threonine protein phosphatase PrpC
MSNNQGMLTIHQPLGFTFQGKRENNEDAIHPSLGTATLQNRFFIVCDGVGGAQKGELASHIAVTGFADYFAKYPTGTFSDAVIKAAFAYVLEEFDAMLKAQYLLRGMATTLTLVGIGEKDVTVAHIGDSRIYQIRSGKIIFKSEDHSKVNYLLKMGLITPQQAQNHPERNVITRAIQGSHKETDIEINHLTDVKSGDYFFQCTDGVLENVTDDALSQILDSDQANEKKLQLLLNLCEGNTRDNYSGYLLQIADVGSTQMANEWVEPIQKTLQNDSENTVELPAVPENISPFDLPQPAKGGQGFWFLGGMLLIIIITAGVLTV